MLGARPLFKRLSMEHPVRVAVLFTSPVVSIASVVSHLREKSHYVVQVVVGSLMPPNSVCCIKMTALSPPWCSWPTKAVLVPSLRICNSERYQRPTVVGYALRECSFARFVECQSPG